MSKGSTYTLVGVMILALIVLPASIFLYNMNVHGNNTAPTPTPTISVLSTSSAQAKAKVITYQGEDGKNALVLLQKEHPDTEVSGEGANAFVTSIDGYAANTAKREFWKVQVNGQDSQVGAGSLETHNGDTITWVIDTY